MEVSIMREGQFWLESNLLSLDIFIYGFGVYDSLDPENKYLSFQITDPSGKITFMDMI